MLFDLSRAIGEKEDLANRNPETLKEVTAVFQAWSDQMEAPRWIRQDRTNAEVGGTLKSAATPQTRRGANLSVEERVDRLFRNDANQDGRLTRKEYSGQYFDALDRYGNGIITRNEAEAMVKQATAN